MGLPPQEPKHAVAHRLELVGDPVVVCPLLDIGVPLEAIDIKQQLRLAVEVDEVRPRQQAIALVYLVLLVRLRQTSIQPDGLEEAKFLWRFPALGLGLAAIRPRRGRHRSYDRELDAIAPAKLRRRVDEAIATHIDAAEWDRLRSVEENEQRIMHELMSEWAA